MEKFKITRTIRFKANPISINKLQDQTKSLSENSEADIVGIINNANQIINDLEGLIFTNEEKNNLRKDVTIHFRWIRQYVKNDWYAWKEKQTNNSKQAEKGKSKSAEKDQLKSPLAQLALLRDKFPDAHKTSKTIQSSSPNSNKESSEKKLPLGDVPFLKEEFTFFCNYWREIAEKLNEAYSREEHNRMRRADIAKHLNELSKRQILPFLSDFLANGNDKKNDEKIKNLIVKVIEFKKDLEIAKNAYLSAQSSGIMLARASFNYYTLNKKPKDFDSEERRIIENMNAKYYQPGNIPQIIKDLKIDGSLSIEKLYEELKSYKAEQKAKFQEAISQGLKFEELQAKFPLFETTQEIFNDYVSKTNLITQKATQKNNTPKGSMEFKRLQDEINKLKRERGKMLQQGKFRNFKALNEEFKRVAVKKGKLKAQLKGIEKERIDSQRLQYWALIGQEENKYKLILIPKENVSKAYTEIVNQRWIDDRVSMYLYYFESFTFRALRKLCFGVNGNTFMPEIKNELPKYNQQDFGEHIFKTEDGKGDEKALVEFYQQVLKTDFVLKNLALPHQQMEEVTTTTFKDLNSFKIALEKICYNKKMVASPRVLRNLELSYGAEIFELSSQDLLKEHSTNLKNHTKIWNLFWSKENEEKNFDTRLNPEIGIFWREPKASRIEKYGEGTAHYDPQKKNRYLHPQFTIAFSINENALSNDLNYAFEGFEKQKEAMMEFNQKINKEFKDGMEQKKLGAFGVDTGEAELATIGLTDNGKPFPVKVLKVKSDKLNYSKQGYFKDGAMREKPYKAIDNLSYYLKKDLYDKTFRDDHFEQTFREIFEEIETETIDLTSSKLICEHIVVNGDLHTRSKLNILNAKRQIRQALITNPNLEIKFEDNKILISETDEERKKINPWKAVYHTNEELEQIKYFEAVKEEIEQYLKKVQDDSAEVLQNINRFREVAAGNMTGVIF